MGIDFAVGREQPSVSDDMKTVGESIPIENRPAREAWKRLVEAIEDEGLQHGERWDRGLQDAFALDAHWAYSGFNRFRTRIAALEGIKLEEMEGFKPMFADENWKGIPWESVDTPLAPFLYHSDCDGEMSPEECAQVYPRLRECVEALAKENLPQDRDVVSGSKLVEMMVFCAENDHHLLFR